MTNCRNPLEQILKLYITVTEIGKLSSKTFAEHIEKPSQLAFTSYT